MMCYLSICMMLVGFSTIAICVHIIDISDSNESMIESLNEALHTDGVIAITGHDLSELVDYIDIGNSLFSLPIESKLDSSISIAYGRGYISSGSESGLQDIYEPKEGFSYGFHYDSVLRVNEFKSPLHLPNKWPTGFSTTNSTKLEKLYDKIILLLQHILKLLGNINIHAIEDGGDKISIMRMFHYFQSADNLEHTDMLSSNDECTNQTLDNVCLGSSPHTDWGLLTAIIQDGTNGLQFYKNNEWIDVPANTDLIIVNAGDYLQYISNGYYRSPIHRVLCPKASDRLSFVLFYYPGYHSIIQFDQSDSRSDNSKELQSLEYNTLLNIKTERKHLNTTFGDYILEKWVGVSRHDFSEQ